MAAVVALQNLHDLADGRLLEPEGAAQPDRPVEIVVAEPVIFSGEIGGNLTPGEPERIEVGGKVAAHPVGADQHHRPDAVLSSASDGLRVAGRLRDAFRYGRLDLLDCRLRRIEAEIQIIELRQRPIRPRPARSAFPFLESGHFVHATSLPGEGRGPGPAQPGSNKVG